MNDKDMLKQRGEASEAQFAYEAELNFRVIVLRDRKLGAWAADQMGFNDTQKKQYAQKLVEVNIDDNDSDALLEKIRTDFDAYKIKCTKRSLRRQMNIFLNEARDEIYK